MYRANGLNLSTSEYKTLNRFIAMAKDNPGVSLPVTGKDAATAALLAEKRLIDGFDSLGTFVLEEVSEYGLDFPRDFKRERRRERFRAYFSVVIGGVLGIAGTIGGVLLGWWLAGL